MAALVKQGRETPSVRAQALALVGQYRQKDYLAEAKAIHEFVRDRVRYVRDPRGVEALHTADRLLQQRQGDCDDKTVLAASLLETLGHKTRLIAVGLDRHGYCHVYPEVNIKGRWYPVETTEPWPFGYMPLKVKLRMVQDV